MNILQCLGVIFTVFGLSCVNSISFQCGKVEEELSTRIAFGTEVSENQWPWLAAIISKENKMLFCGGTLISLKSVLTAAHCIHEKRGSYKPSDFEIHLGRHSLRNVRELEESAKVLEPIIIALHPEWNPKNYSDFRYDADLALLIAATEVEPSSSISPICLPDRDIQNVVGTIVGWGFSSGEKEYVEDIARQAEAERVSPEDCFLEDNPLVRIASKRAFCAKGVIEGASPCRGDSGGGFYAISGDVWFIHGIVSSSLVEPSFNCPRTRHSLFTKISSFTSWIREGIKEFYDVKFTYSFINNNYRSLPHHELVIADVLRRGGFLSTVGESEDLEVNYLVCANQDWKYLPNNIGYLFPNLDRIEAFLLNLKSIERINFKNLEQLQDLELRNNLIEEIPSDCFKDLKNVLRVGISWNKLKTIHPNTFVHCPSLKKINLSHNQIASSELKNLKHRNVEELDLTENQLQSVPFDAFHGLDNLKVLYLAYNKLSTFHEDTFLKNPALTLFNAWNNQIQNLPEGLFRNNTNLNNLDLAVNKITKIGVVFYSYGEYSFRGNTCINENFSPSNQSELSQMNEKLKSLCGQK